MLCSKRSTNTFFTTMGLRIFFQLFGINRQTLILLHSTCNFFSISAYIDEHFFYYNGTCNIFQHFCTYRRTLIALNNTCNFFRLFSINRRTLNVLHSTCNFFNFFCIYTVLCYIMYCTGLRC